MLTVSCAASFLQKRGLAGLLEFTARDRKPSAEWLSQLVHEAVTTACMARELFETTLIKLEVIGDEMNLQPDPFALVDAKVIWIKTWLVSFPIAQKTGSQAAAS